MNEKLKIWLKKTACIFSICLLAVMAVPGMKSAAASGKPTCVKKQTVYVSKQNTPYSETVQWSTRYSGAIYIKNLSSDARITNIKSSNKKVKVKNMFNVAEDHATRFKGLWVEGNGCGTGTKSKISFKVKQGGKTYSLSYNVAIKQEPARYSSLKIGGKNYASELSGYEAKVLTLPRKKVKLSVKLKSGMKLEGISVLTQTGMKKMKNGASVKLREGDQIFIDYCYKKKPANYSSCLGRSGKDFYLYGTTTIYVK